MFRRKLSPICPSDYVLHILEYGCVSECCFLVATIYIERLKRAGHVVRLTSTSLQRLFGVAVMVAAKFSEDCQVSNNRW